MTVKPQRRNPKLNAPVPHVVIVVVVVFVSVVCDVGGVPSAVERVPHTRERSCGDLHRVAEGQPRAAARSAASTPRMLKINW